MADNLDAPRGEIDVLIGSDFYWSIVTEGLKQGDKGQIAINSKLGWLLSGPIHNSSNARGTQTGLILTDSGTELFNTTENDTLTDMLKRFCDTDSIGICDKPHESIIDEFFLKSVQYKNGHYEVS